MNKRDGDGVCWDNLNGLTHGDDDQDKPRSLGDHGTMPAGGNPASFKTSRGKTSCLPVIESKVAFMGSYLLELGSYILRDAALLLTVGSFLLTVEPFLLVVVFWSSLLAL